MKGLFVSFEGTDGSGKTTQISFLKHYLQDKGFDVLITREPGGTKISEQIRNVLLDNANLGMSPVCEMLLYAAARAEHVDKIIIPALNEGKIVLCDRFIDSSLAYQGFGRGLGVDIVEQVNTTALSGLMPDLTLLFTVNTECGIARRIAAKKETDRLESEAMDFHDRVSAGFTEISLRYPDRIKVLNAEQSIENLFNDVKIHVENLIGKSF